MQNTHKLQQIPQKDVKYAVICVQSGKFYTGQNFFTRAPPVVPVTNMRYESKCCIINLGVLPGESWPEVGAICWQIEILEINQKNRRRRLLTRL